MAQAIEVQIVEVSEYGFQAYAKQEIPLNNWFPAEVRVGREEVSTVQALAVRDHANGFNGFYGFRVGEPDLVWRKFVSVLSRAQRHDDLENATMFLT